MYKTWTTSLRVASACCNVDRDIFQALFSLFEKIVGNRHCCVIEAGCAGNEDPVTVNDGA